MLYDHAQVRPGLRRTGLCGVISEANGRLSTSKNPASKIRLIPFIYICNFHKTQEGLHKFVSKNVLFFFPLPVFKDSLKIQKCSFDEAVLKLTSGADQSIDYTLSWRTIWNIC